MFFFLGAEFSLRQAEYVVYEHQEVVRVCVDLTNSSAAMVGEGLDQNVTLQFRTEEDTAGKY